MRKHTGGVGKGVERIRLSHANKFMNIGGMDHVADEKVIYGYWTQNTGRAVEEYEQRIEYLHVVAQVLPCQAKFAHRLWGNNLSMPVHKGWALMKEKQSQQLYKPLTPHPILYVFYRKKVLITTVLLVVQSRSFQVNGKITLRKKLRVASDPSRKL